MVNGALEYISRDLGFATDTVKQGLLLLTIGEPLFGGTGWLSGPMCLLDQSIAELISLYGVKNK